MIAIILCILMKVYIINSATILPNLNKFLILLKFMLHIDHAQSILQMETFTIEVIITFNL
jgi:hypothetical protein